MISDVIQKWPLMFVTLVVANPQIPMPYPIYAQPPMFPMLPQPPMFPMLPPPPPAVPMLPPPPMPMPMPLPMPMQVGLAIVSEEEAGKQNKQTTTEKPTTITSKNDNIAVAIPMPMSMSMQLPMPMPISMPMPMSAPSPVLFAVPGMMSSVCKKNAKHPNCPPCPPCSCNPCTPSFFSYCSTCHQKCRCRKPEDVPLIPPPKAPNPLPGPAFPMPYPGYVPNSQNLVFVPFAPQMAPRRPKKGHSNREVSESDSCESSHLRKGNVARLKKPRFKYSSHDPPGRKNRRLDVDRNDNVIAKPVLNFLAPDGQVKMRRPLNKIDASILMNEDDESIQNMHMDEDLNSKYNLLRSKKKQNRKTPKKQILSYKHLDKGRKHMVFRPPADMLVGNLSVSFNT